LLQWRNGMKPHRDASALAARIAGAASKPVPLPAPVLVANEPEPAPMAEAAQPRTRAIKAKRTKKDDETVPITLRPSRATLTRYTLAAADRTRQVGRVFSAQEMMLEKLEEAS
jgi:hypothetical protein